MANYYHTTEVGSTRRRAKRIIIENPAVPLNPQENEQVETPRVIFVMEDRILLADGKEMFVPQGNLFLDLNAETLSKLYPSIDVNTGITNADKSRSGGQIMQLIIDALEDVFITEGIVRDNPPAVAPVPAEE